MKILNVLHKSWILFGAISSLSMVGLDLLNNLANAQSITDTQQLITRHGDRLISERSKLDIPVGSTKINTTSTAKDPIKKIVGTWVNTNIKTEGITKLIVTKTGKRHSVHLFGKCNPNDCDLGKRLLRSSFWENSGSTHIEAIYKESNTISELDINLVGMLEVSPPSKIMVSFSKKFTDQSGRSNYSSNEIFRKI